MSLSKTRGDFGEEEVCRYLERGGVKIIRRNYKKKYGELDIIAEENNLLLVVEVKTRKKGSMISGVEAMTWTKQNRIVITTELFLLETGIKKSVRFDVADVVISEREPLQVLDIKYYKDAFDGTGKGLITI